MTTAEHDEDQHAFTRRMPGAAKGEVVVRDASADAHVAKGRNDVKKNVEGGEPGCGPRKICTLDGANEKKGKEQKACVGG